MPPIPLITNPTLTQLNDLGGGFPPKQNFELGTELNTIITAVNAGGGSSPWVEVGGKVSLVNAGDVVNLNVGVSPVQINGAGGNAGDVFTSNGAGAAPTWQAPAGGASPWTEAAGVVSLNNAAWTVETPLLMHDAGGAATIKTVDGSSNRINLLGGSNTTGGTAGIAYVAGGPSLAGTGGQATVAGGPGNTGGLLYLAGGGGTAGAGGKVTVTSGASTGAATGDLEILTPNTMTSASSGSVLIQTGAAPNGSAAVAGSISVLAGAGNGGFPAGNIGGNINIKAGDGQGQGGTLTLWAGDSVGTKGTIEINRVGGTTNILGTLNAPYAAGGGVGVVWAVSVPTTIKDALDRIAAQLAVLGGGPIP